MKQVTFSSTVHVQEHIYQDENYKQGEGSVNWYSRKELVSMRDKCRIIVATMRQEKSSTITSDENRQNGETTRGLERLAERCAAQKRARQAVLCEQSMQRAEKLDDPEEIADVYMEYSLRCQKEAQSVALQDRQEVEDNFICDEAKDWCLGVISSHPWVGHECRLAKRQDRKLIRSDFRASGTSSDSAIPLAAV